MKIVLVVASALFASACGTFPGVPVGVPVPGPTVTATATETVAKTVPGPTVTATVVEQKEDEEDMVGKSGTDVTAAALALAWEEMPYSSQQTLCDSYQIMPNVFWAQWKEAAADNPGLAPLSQAQVFQFMESRC